MAAAVFSALASAALAGCASVAVDGPNLTDTRWHVAAVNGRPTPATGDYRIEFEGEHGGAQLGRRLGCNGFGGPVAVSGETMTAGQIVATQMGCSEPADYFESAGFAIFRLPMRWQRSADGRLTLTNQAGSIVLERLP